MNKSSKKAINIRIVLINICPFITTILFFFLAFWKDLLIIPAIIWLTIVNYDSFEKTHLFIIIQSIMLGAVVVSDSISAVLFHFFIDDIESQLIIYILQFSAQIEVAFLVAITVITSIVKALHERKRSKIIPNFTIDYPLFSISPKTVEFLSSLKASPIEHEFVTNGYVTFAGKAFGSDIPVMFGVHFNVSKIEFIEVYRPLEYYQSDDYDINKSFSQLSEILKRQYGKPVITTSASIGGYPCEQWNTPCYTVNHYIIDRFEPEEHLHINFYKK